MKLLAVNGSPRKDRNTATLLRNVVDGARDGGAEAGLVHLWDLPEFGGCVSCFACKRAGGPSFGRCAVRDGLTPLLDEIRESVDALVLGSPVYLCNLPGKMRSFFERLIYPYYVYDDERSSLFGRSIPTAAILCMNLEEEKAKNWLYDEKLGDVRHFLAKIFGPAAELRQVYFTYQFDDYAKYHAPAFREEEKARQRRERFPGDCRAAFEIGRRFARGGGG